MSNANCHGHYCLFKARVYICLTLLYLPCSEQVMAQSAAQVDVPKIEQNTSTDRSSLKAELRTTIPYKQEHQSTDTLAYQSLAALVLVGFAAYGIALGLKRFNLVSSGSNQKKRARTIDTVRLSRRSTLFVVEYQDRELLLVESEKGIQLLLCVPVNVSPSSNVLTTDQSASSV